MEGHTCDARSFSLLTFTSSSLPLSFPPSTPLILSCFFHSLPSCPISSISPFFAFVSFQIICRSLKPIDQTVKSKISNFCHVKASQVVLHCLSQISKYYQDLVFTLLTRVCVCVCVCVHQVVAVHDCSSIYRVPLLLLEQDVLSFFLKRLEISALTQHGYLHKWKNLADRLPLSLSVPPLSLPPSFSPPSLPFPLSSTPLSPSLQVINNYCCSVSL